MTTASAIAEYNIKRYRDIVSSTNNLIIAFLFTLIYVWLQSIEPNRERIADYKSKNALIKQFGDSLVVKYEHIRNFYLFRLKTSGKASDSSAVAKMDSLLLNLKMKKQQAKFSADSIKNNINIKIQVPTLSAIELPLRPGLFTWMGLLLVFQVLLFYRRLKAIRYLTNGLYYYKGKLLANNYNLKCLDVRIPFWIGPLTISGSPYERRVLFVITDWKPWQKALLSLLVLFLFLLLFRVWEVNILFNNMLSDADSITNMHSELVKLIGSILFAIFTITISVWIQTPQKVSLK